MKKVIYLASPRGFCAGVSRAVGILDKVLLKVLPNNTVLTDSADSDLTSNSKISTTSVNLNGSVDLISSESTPHSQDSLKFLHSPQTLHSSDSPISPRPQDSPHSTQNSSRFPHSPQPEKNTKINVLGEIVHNKHVIKQYKQKGVLFDADIKNVSRETICIFPAHGVSPEVKNKWTNAINATCPLVQNVHHQVINYTKKGYNILLIGDINHQEVKATYAESPNNITVIGKTNDINKYVLNKNNLNKKVVWLSQTTLNIDDVKNTVKKLKELLITKGIRLQDPKAESICYATRNRQNAVKELVKKVELLIVVGSKNSSNTIKLFNIGKKFVKTVRVDSVKELNVKLLQNVDKVGVTSGASVPEELVKDIISKLKYEGFNKVIELKGVKENIKFPLPKLNI